LAAEGGYPQAARILLERKADINAQTQKGNTPLHLALLFGNIDVAELLLGHGVDVNARNNADSTPLHLALCKKMGEFESPCPSLKVVCLLLEHGADVEAKDDEGKTAFHFASSNGLHDIAKLLSKHGTE
jgi:ankyrin repeat protein